MVAEPTAKSLEVAARAVDLARRRGLARVVLAANRVRDDDDLARVRATFPDLDVVVVPEEPDITEAERRGEAPFDVAPRSAGVRALVGLTDHLVA